MLFRCAIGVMALLGAQSLVTGDVVGHLARAVAKPA